MSSPPRPRKPENRPGNSAQIGGDRDPGGRAARQQARLAAAAARDTAGRNRWWRRGWRIVRRRLAHGLVWLLAPTLVRLWAASWRVERRDAGRFAAALEEGAILWLWHGDLAVMLPLHARRGIQVLVSPSRDGALVATVLRRSGYRVTWGSSNRAASRALRSLQSDLAAGRSVAITPDGPRGPRHSVNLGPAWLARETGRPILGLVAHADRGRRTGSWDRMLLPAWRAKVELAYVGPWQVPRDAGEAELERVTAEIAAAMSPLES